MTAEGTENGRDHGEWREGREDLYGSSVRQDLALPSRT